MSIKRKRKVKTEKLLPPSYYIREQMNSRKWNEAHIAKELGMPMKFINSLLQNRERISISTARLLAQMFETTPEYWMNIDENYWEWVE